MVLKNSQEYNKDDPILNKFIEILGYADDQILSSDNWYSISKKFCLKWIWLLKKIKLYSLMNEKLN